MRATVTVILAAVFAVAAGCASNAPKVKKEGMKFHVSEKARKLLEEQGKSLAAIRGYSDTTDLVCERFEKTGSHITYNYCYTRAEMEARRLNHQEKMRKASTPGAKCLEGGGAGALSGRGVRGTAGICQAGG